MLQRIFGWTPSTDSATTQTVSTPSTQRQIGRHRHSVHVKSLPSFASSSSSLDMAHTDMVITASIHDDVSSTDGSCSDMVGDESNDCSIQCDGTCNSSFVRNVQRVESTFLDLLFKFPVTAERPLLHTIRNFLTLRSTTDVLPDHATRVAWLLRRGVLDHLAPSLNGDAPTSHQFEALWILVNVTGSEQDAHAQATIVHPIRFTALLSLMLQKQLSTVSTDAHSNEHCDMIVQIFINLVKSCGTQFLEEHGLLLQLERIVQLELIQFGFHESGAELSHRDTHLLNLVDLLTLIVRQLEYEVQCLVLHHCARLLIECSENLQMNDALLACMEQLSILPDVIATLIPSASHKATFTASSCASTSASPLSSEAVVSELFEQQCAIISSDNDDIIATLDPLLIRCQQFLEHPRVWSQMKRRILAILIDVTSLDDATFTQSCIDTKLLPVLCRILFADDTQGENVVASSTDDMSMDTNLINDRIIMRTLAGQVLSNVTGGTPSQVQAVLGIHYDSCSDTHGDETSASLWFVSACVRLLMGEVSWGRHTALMRNLRFQVVWTISNLLNTQRVDIWHALNQQQRYLEFIVNQLLSSSQWRDVQVGLHQLLAFCQADASLDPVASETYLWGCRHSSRLLRIFQRVETIFLPQHAKEAEPLLNYFRSQWTVAKATSSRENDIALLASDDEENADELTPSSSGASTPRLTTSILPRSPQAAADHDISW